MVASGSGVRRGDIEEALTELETQGYQIRDAVLRIWWHGERDATALTRELNEREAVLVHRVLEMIGEKPVQSNSSNFVFADTLHGHSGPVRSLVFTPDGQFLASGGEGELKIWNSHTAQLIRTFMDEFGDRVDSIAISSASPVLAHVDKIDGTIKLWNLYTGKLIRELLVFDRRQPSLTCTLALSPDGRILAGRNDEAIKLWELASGRLIHQTSRDHNGTVYSIAFSPDGKMLASGLKDGIELWYLPPRDFAFTLKSDQASFSYGIPSMAFSPDGQLLVTGNFADTFYLWSLSTRKLFRTMTGHSTWVRAIAISPDGQLLASASGDGMIKLWQLRTGRILDTLKEHSDGIFCLVFSPDGQLLASSCQDGTINIWRRS